MIVAINSIVFTGVYKVIQQEDSIEIQFRLYKRFDKEYIENCIKGRGIELVSFSKDKLGRIIIQCKKANPNTSPTLSITESRRDTIE